MQIYIKSAGFSIDQDYSWVDENGVKTSIDLNISSCNIEGVKFVWKAIGQAILIFCNGFVDGSRVDLYNRPLRNYMLIVGKIGEADKMLSVFSNIILNQGRFENLLNNSIRNSSENSEVGFSVEFQSMLSFLYTQSIKMESRKLNRYLNDNDTYEARTILINELYGWTLSKRTPITIFVGGNLSNEQLAELTPDRALLNNITSERYYRPSKERLTKSIMKVLPAMVGGVAITLSIIALINRKKLL